MVSQTINPSQAKQLQTFHLLDLVVSALGIAVGTKLFQFILSVVG